MISLRALVQSHVEQAFVSAGYDAVLGLVTPSERPDLGDFQASGAMRGAKQYGKSPRQIAEDVAAVLARNTEVFSRVQVDGPGFINLGISPTCLRDFIQNYATAPALISPSEGAQKIVIDFGGPNVAKALHVGHLRSSVIGDSLCRLHRLVGHEVYGDIHLGDWGTPMGMLIAYIARQQPDLPYFDQSFTGDYPETSPVGMEDLMQLYPAASALFKDDADFQKAAQLATAELQAGRRGYRALWQHFIAVSVADLRLNFDRLGVHFDWWYGESHYHDRIEPLIERLRSQGQAVESKGALVIPLEHTPDGKEIPPLILVKSDGAFLYSTTDLAAIEERVEVDNATHLLYVVDQRQGLHFTQVFQAARQTGIAPESVSLTHAGFGTVNGVDGKPFKTRAGGVMKLSDLITMVTEKAYERMEAAGISQHYEPQERQAIAEKVGIAALKFADLANHRQSNYVFDVDRFVSFEGKVGPYLVYAAVRIRSILRKLELETMPEYAFTEPTDVERPLMMALGGLPDAVNNALEGSLPHLLCDYVFTLGQEFNRFYQQTSIIKETDPIKKSHLICIIRFTLAQLELVLGVLGMPIPERM